MRRIAADYIYTLEADSPIKNGFVEVDKDGTILNIGVCDDVKSEPEYYRGAIIPGFVNTHCHVELSYLWRKFHKGTGMAGFIDQINALRDNKSKVEKLSDIECWMQIMWERGVSAMGDISNCDDSF